MKIVPNSAQLAADKLKPSSHAPNIVRAAPHNILVPSSMPAKSAQDAVVVKLSSLLKMTSVPVAASVDPASSPAVRPTNERPRPTNISPKPTNEYPDPAAIIRKMPKKTATDHPDPAAIYRDLPERTAADQPKHFFKTIKELLESRGGGDDSNGSSTPPSSESVTVSTNVTS